VAVFHRDVDGGVECANPRRKRGPGYALGPVDATPLESRRYVGPTKVPGESGLRSAIVEEASLRRCAIVPTRWRTAPSRELGSHINQTRP
jgi:hypothetical protein